MTQVRTRYWVPRLRRLTNKVINSCRVNFAGPLKYLKKKKEAKAYIIVYACSLSRALYLEVTTSLETTEFLQSLKRFIARRGRPKKIYFDNGSTFVAAAKWLRAAMKYERLYEFLTNTSST